MIKFVPAGFEPRKNVVPSRFAFRRGMHKRINMQSFHFNLHVEFFIIPYDPYKVYRQYQIFL
jgi:hypothetical protein